MRKRKPNPTKALERAIEVVGGQSEMARQLDTAQPVVWRWLHKYGRCPAPRAIPIERLSGVSRKELRPDIYPD